MATLYSVIIKETALRVNGIAGSQVATVETNYASTTLTTAAMDNPRYPPAAIIDAVLDSEAMICTAIGNTKDHIWRNLLRELSNFINSGDPVPTAAGAGNMYIGTLNPPFIAIGNRELEEAEYGDVRAYLDAPGYFVSNPYIYALRGDIIFHTAAANTVKISGCTYDRADQLAAITGPMKLPDTAVPIYVAGAVSILTRDSEYAAQAQIYRNYFESSLAQLVSGETVFRAFSPEPPMAAKSSL